MTNEASHNATHWKNTNERVFSKGDRVRLLKDTNSFFDNKLKKGKPGTVVDICYSGGAGASYYGIEYPRDHALVDSSQIILHRDPIVTRKNNSSKSEKPPAIPEGAQ